MSITAANIHLLGQGLDLVRSIDRELFGNVGALSGERGSIGAHMRHSIDCYLCFLSGQKEGRVDYDARGRHPGIEREPAVAEAALLEVIEGLHLLEGTEADRPLEVRVDAAAWVGSPLGWSRSTLGRELQFLLSHTVHHYALIAMLARGEGYELDPTFGIAPSTLEHRRENRLCAR